MGLQAMNEAEYRALSADELEKRRADVIKALQGELSTELSTDELSAEVERVMAEDKRRKAIMELRNLRASNVVAGAGKTIAFTGEGHQGGAEGEDGDYTNTIGYRKAFMEYVLRRAPMPAEYREAQNTKTGDVGTAIPTHLVNQIVEKMDHCGEILARATRTSIPAGIVIPTSSVKPVATWVAEGAGSDTQKKTTSSISFNLFKLRCEISMSAEVGAMALSSFEAKFVENVSKAMVIAVEKAMLAGNGTSQPTGVLTDDAENIVSVKCAKDTVSYADLCAVEAEIPQEYEADAVWCMTKKQFMKFMAMTDDNGQPIARINYGIGGKPERTLLGREVVIHSYADEMCGHLAFVFVFSDYVLNTIYDLGIQKKQDWDTEDLRTKAVMSVDGKPVDLGSRVVLDAKPSA